MHIDNIIQKYWDGNTTLEEEAQIKTYLMSDNVAEVHQSMVTLFKHNESLGQQSMPNRISADDIISLTGTQSGLEEQVVIDEILDEYWKGITSDEAESRLRSYLLSGDIAAEHQYLVPLFEYYNTAAGIKPPSELRANDILDASDGEQSSDNSAPPQQSSKSRMRQLMPRIASLAAVFALTLAVVFLMPSSTDNSRTYAESAEAEEALEVTMEALAFLGKNYEKGYAPMQHLRQLEKTNVFKINKAQ